MCPKRQMHTPKGTIIVKKIFVHIKETQLTITITKTNLNEFKNDKDISPKISMIMESIRESTIMME